MSAPLSPERLAEIRAREQAATASPELTRYLHGGGRLAVFGGPDRELVADFYDAPNREFYYHARQDIPALLDEVERLTGELATERARLDFALAHGHITYPHMMERAVGGRFTMRTREEIDTVRAIVGVEP